MSGNDREYIRLNMNTKVFVEIMAAEPRDGGDSDSDSVLVECDVVDVSFGGLKVNLDAELIKGSILSICVVMPSFDDPFYMAGEVKWCRLNEEEGGQWSAGFQLLTSSDSDIEQWREVLTHV